ncbi:MAG: hypothetical protein LBC13_00520 [Clostridiales bacterium]|jgi:hypothetical protein|nr:hypothetical protein [Clostridiales bacterium]
MLFGRFGFMRGKNVLPQEKVGLYNINGGLTDENEAIKTADRYAAEAETAYNKQSRAQSGTSARSHGNPPRVTNETVCTQCAENTADRGVNRNDTARGRFDKIKEPVPIEEIRPPRFVAEDYRARHRRLSGEINRRLKK